MKEHLHILQHSLGLDQYGQGRQYRNHFVTGPKTIDWPACRALVEAGLMVEHPGSALSGGDSIFTVTPAGIGFVAQNSPKPPKLTRSQKRYQAYLNAGTGLTFAEYIGVRS